MFGRMIRASSTGAIRFRIFSDSNPLGPELINDESSISNEDEFVIRGLENLPKRYQYVQQLLTDAGKPFEWRNGDATMEKTNTALGLYILLDWLLYFVFAYFTLINYSYFIEQQVSKKPQIRST